MSSITGPYIKDLELPYNEKFMSVNCDMMVLTLLNRLFQT
jgi:hypothetical protein